MLKHSYAQNTSVIILKDEHRFFNNTLVLHPKDTQEMAISVDPAQTAP